MIIIEIKDGETLDKALRKYKKKFEKLGILKETRRRMYFTPPSVERREVVKKANRRQKYTTEQDAI
jgi:small subunit ribosomal protein S21